MEFINEKPEGFETEISQGGTNVSGGQKQRFLLHVLLLRNLKYLYLMIVFLLLTLRQMQHYEKH